MAERVGDFKKMAAVEYGARYVSDFPYRDEEGAPLTTFIELKPHKGALTVEALCGVRWSEFEEEWESIVKNPCPMASACTKPYGDIFHWPSEMDEDNGTEVVQLIPNKGVTQDVYIVQARCLHNPVVEDKR